MVARRDEIEIYASLLLSKTNVMPTVLILYWLLSAVDLYLYPILITQTFPFGWPVR